MDKPSATETGSQNHDALKTLENCQKISGVSDESLKKFISAYLLAHNDASYTNFFSQLSKRYFQTAVRHRRRELYELGEKDEAKKDCSDETIISWLNENNTLPKSLATGIFAEDIFKELVKSLGIEDDLSDVRPLPDQTPEHSLLSATIDNCMDRIEAIMKNEFAESFQLAFDDAESRKCVKKVLSQ